MMIIGKHGRMILSVGMICILNSKKIAAWHSLCQQRYQCLARIDWLESPFVKVPDTSNQTYFQLNTSELQSFICFCVFVVKSDIANDPLLIIPFRRKPLAIESVGYTWLVMEWYDPIKSIGVASFLSSNFRMPEDFNSVNLALTFI